MSCSIELKVSNFLQKCSFKQLKQIHAFVTTTSLQQNTYIQLKFLRRSTEFGGMDYANLIFSHLDGLCNTQVTLWNAMIRGYAYNGPFENCLSLYDEMYQRGLKPNNFTYPYVLNSCSHLGWFRIGSKVHCQIIKAGFDCVFAVALSLFDFYVVMVDSFELGKNVRLNDARKIFDSMHSKPIELWNRIMAEYVNLGEICTARLLFDEMPERDVVSWNTMVSGYAQINDVVNARDLFEKMPERNVVSWTTMIQVYASCKDLQTARKFFETMPKRNVVSWNCMISSYTQNGKFEEALDLFFEMQSQNVDPDGFTFVSALSACSHIGALNFGKWIHCLITDWPDLVVRVSTALVEMYAKCGDVDKAFGIFIKIHAKDVFCYNVMIKALAINGRTDDAIRIFYLMQRRGLRPNDFTFSAALFACSHGGWVEEGRWIFQSMESKYAITPNLEHYGCIIDLLSRNGQVEEAHSVVKKMPFEPDVAIWGALLSGCRLRGDLKLAQHIMETARNLYTNESGVYALLSNIHASQGQWPEALDVREKMGDENLWKNTGNSSVFVDDDAMGQDCHFRS